MASATIGVRVGAAQASLKTLIMDYPAIMEWVKGSHFKHNRRTEARPGIEAHSLPNHFSRNGEDRSQQIQTGLGNEKGSSQAGSNGGRAEMPYTYGSLLWAEEEAAVTCHRKHG